MFSNGIFDDSDIVLILLSGVFGFFLKCAWKGVTFVVFCLHIRNWYTIDFIASLVVNVLFLLSKFIQLKSLLIVCIKRSTNPIALWSLAGAVIMLILCCLQKLFTLNPIKQRAWSNLIFQRTLCIWMYSSKKLIALGLLASSMSSTVGYLEKRSMHSRKWKSWSFSFVIGPPKSICVYFFIRFGTI